LRILGAAGELEDFGGDQRLRADDFEDGLEPGVRRFLGQTGHAPQYFARAERDLHPAADIDLVRQLWRNEVIELLAEGDFQADVRNHICRSRCEGMRLVANYRTLSTTVRRGFQSSRQNPL
jgi:hypothetical protein